VGGVGFRRAGGRWGGLGRRGESEGKGGGMKGINGERRGNTWHVFLPTRRGKRPCLPISHIHYNLLPHFLTP